MAILGNVLCWLFSIIFVLIGIMIVGMGSKGQSLFLFLIALSLMPPVRKLFANLTNIQVKWWYVAIVVVILWSSFLVSLRLIPAKSIYKSPEYKETLLKIYDEKLAEWPFPYEEKYVNTKYGKIHVVISGPEDGYPVMLINASALSGWSWIYNVKELNKTYRTYAIDNIGEAGKNEMIRPGFIPSTGEEIAELYSNIADSLGIEKSHVIGASIGGYISTNYAIYAPEKVDKLVLLGSMGYGFTLKTIATMTIAQGYPIKFIQDKTFVWAFGDDPKVVGYFDKWFRTVMKGMVPTPIAPRSFTPEDLKKIKSPVLAYFGTKDDVVGDYKKARALAENSPNITIEIVDTGHLIGAEIPDEVNKKLMSFF